MNWKQYIKYKFWKSVRKILAFSGIVYGFFCASLLAGDDAFNIVYGAHLHNSNCYPANTKYHSCSQSWPTCCQYGAYDWEEEGHWEEGGSTSCNTCNGTGTVTGSVLCPGGNEEVWSNIASCDKGHAMTATWTSCSDCGWLVSIDWSCGCDSGHHHGHGYITGSTTCSSCNGSGYITAPDVWVVDKYAGYSCPFSGKVVWNNNNWLEASMNCHQIITSNLSLESTCVHTGESKLKVISISSNAYSHIVPSVAQNMIFVVSYTTLDGNNHRDTLTYVSQTGMWNCSGLKFLISGYRHNDYSPTGQVVSVMYTNPSSKTSYSGKVYEGKHYITVDGFMSVGFKNYNALMGTPRILATQIDSVNFPNQYLIGQNIYADGGAKVGYHLTHWTYGFQNVVNRNLTNYDVYFKTDNHQSFGGHYDGVGWVNVVQDGVSVTDVSEGGLDYVIKDYRPLGIYFTPHYEPDTYKVEFMADAKGVPLKTMTISYGQTANDVPIPVRQGYIFLGWFLNDRVVTNGTIFSEELLGNSKDVVKNGATYTVAARWLDLTDSLLIRYDSFYKKNGQYVNSIDGLPEVADRYGFDWQEWYFKEFMNNGSDYDTSTSHKNPIY